MTRPPISVLLALSSLFTSAFSVGAAEDTTRPATASPPRNVCESPRDIPIAYAADLVIVGGSTGAVSAAVAAAEQGAKVFLAAPFPYLGEDMTATLRLWLEPGERPKSPLARRIFNDTSREDPNGKGLAFSYVSDRSASSPHPDTTPPSRLSDGRWNLATDQSVQYDEDVTITADLGSVQSVRSVAVTFFRRRAGSDPKTGFEVGRATLWTSQDKKTWHQVDKIENDLPFQDVSRLSLNVGTQARYIRLLLTLPEDYTRMLIGEITIHGPRPPAKAGRSDTLPPRPMHVKKTLDDVLIQAGVQYLYSCYATDLLYNADGDVAGIVIANRAGRQAVLAKTVIDATSRATMARVAGARFRPYPKGNHTFQRVVIGGHPADNESLKARIPAAPYSSVYANPAGDSTNTFDIIEYTLSLPMADDRYGSYMKADQIARTMTYDPDQQFTSDILFEVPPDPMHGQETADGPFRNVDALPLGAFRPEGIDRFWVLGGCADVSRRQAEGLLRPLALIDLGARIGQAAAAAVQSISESKPVRLSGASCNSSSRKVNVREALSGVRPVGTYKTIHQQARALPILNTCDVVVIGGGTGGGPAGIGAARQDAKTLVIEYLYGLGGVGTQGAISSYYWGNRIGFTATVLDGATKWPIEPKMEWYRKQLLDAGGEVWFGTIGCGAVVDDDNRVIGAVVATPYGRGVVLANTVIDATGNSDVAAAAGANCMYTDATEFGMQGTGLPGRQLGGSYNNTDFTIVDETDLLDIWRMFVFSKNKYANAFDHGRLIDTRERRRIVGGFTLSILDEVNQRTYPDTVVQAYSNFDTHGYTIDKYFLLEHPEKKGIHVNIPIRAMLPDGLEGIIVTGLSISAQRDAIPLIRMQADIQNGGYAAGVASAMAARRKIPIRQIYLRELQEHLIKIGNLTPSVLEDKDSYPLSDAKLAEAVTSLPNGIGAAVIMTEPQRSIPMLEKAYAGASGDAKLVYAKALAVLGQATGLVTLLDAVQQAKQWDAGWDYKGMGQFGSALSPLDELVICLGRVGNPKAIPAILEKLKQLDRKSPFSHYRAVALALELIGDPEAAKPLAEALARPGITGHVQNDLESAKRDGTPGGTTAERPRRNSLRELLLARALYRCGDYQNVGQTILKRYTHDLRGHLARHAQAILDAGHTGPKAAEK